MPQPISEILTDLHPLIETLRNKAGVPGLAIGVIHQGEVVHEGFLGHRDVEDGLSVDRNTLFYVASLTKAMTVTAIGILVDQGRLQWNTPVHDILPEMSRDTELFRAKLNVLDILSHRTGKAWADALYLESNNNILLPKDQSIPTFDYLPQVSPVRSQYMYNNHAYNIAGLVIERVSGMSWERFMAENLFKPLGMTRTFTTQPEDENIAAPYNILTDKTPSRLPFCNVSNETMMFAGQSVRTSLGDLLKYSLAYLQALEEITPSICPDSLKGNSIPPEALQPTMLTRFKSYLSGFFGAANTSEANSFGRSGENPIKQIPTIIRPHIARPIDSLLEQTYALGWN